MRAYWMMDAIRARSPKTDPLLLSCGPKDNAVETALMLTPEFDKNTYGSLTRQRLSLHMRKKRRIFFLQSLGI